MDSLYELHVHHFSITLTTLDQVKLSLERLVAEHCSIYFPKYSYFTHCVKLYRKNQYWVVWVYRSIAYTTTLPYEVYFSRLDEALRFADAINTALLQRLTDSVLLQHSP